MHKLFFLAVVIAAAFTSCKTDKEISNVFYKDFVPDVIIKMPVKDTLTYNLDVDNDLKSDLHFYLEHSFYYFGPHPYDTYNIIMIGSDSLQFINKGFISRPCDISFPDNTEIKINDPATDALELVNNNNKYDLNCNIFFQKRNAAFIMYKNGNRYLGWIRLQVTEDVYDVIIDDFATCLSPALAIKTGQH